MLEGKNILVGVTGGIACYKTCEAVSRFKKLGAGIDVIMTENAAKFVSPLTFETLSGRPVVTDTFNRERPWEVDHVSLAKKADLIVIAPATANIIAKLRTGIADDMLSTTCLASTCPIIVCPAMNTAMLNAPATQENISKLKSRGVIFVGTETGILACGDIGDGRMAEPETIVEAVIKHFGAKRDLEGKRVLITAGGTEESIDAVRVITNHSSGKMGAALAAEALSRGAEVTVVVGRVSVPMPTLAKVIKVTTTDEMAEAVLSSDNFDFYIMAAAPSDYKPFNKSGKKIKSERVTLELVKNIDIACELGKRKKGKLIIFSAETDDLLENAALKLKKKNADLVVANDVGLKGAGFNADTNIVTLIDRDGNAASYGLMPKSEVACVIIDKAVTL